MPLLISLSEVMKIRKFDLYEKVCIMVQLLKAKIEIKEQNVIHRDLKLDNILLENEKVDVTKDFTVKLTDFDLSFELIESSKESL